MISVVVCVKNEEVRIEECLESIVNENPDEIVLVDGDSCDSTIDLAKKFSIKIINSKNSNLTRDRQKGIDACRNDFIAMIDADHRLNPGDLKGLKEDLIDFNFDIVQAALKIKPMGFWCKGEKQYIDLILNNPGEKKMIGVAPCLYRRKVFDFVKFDDNITTTIDDTDFMYRLSKIGKFKIGTGHTQILSLHESGLLSYLKKFRWYGKGDGEFCVKNPERSLSMLFHLIIRYPIIYSVKSIMAGKLTSVPFVILQGVVRVFYLIVRFVELKFKKVNNHG
jgi:glycosyltransferase involved in cell wall biosynthesis